MFHVERVTWWFCVLMPMFHVERKQVGTMFHVEQRNRALAIFNKEISKNICKFQK